MESRIRPFGLKSLVLIGLLSASLAMTGCNSDGEDGKDGVNADPAELAAIQNDVKDLNAEIASLNTDVTKQNAEITSLKEEIASLEKDLAAATDPAIAAAIQDKIDKLTLDLGTTQAALVTTQAALVTAQTDLAATQADLAAATVASPESCAVCHSDVASQHAATDVFTIGTVAVTPNGGALEFTFNVKVDGVNSDAYALRRAYVNWDDPTLVDPALITSFVRTTIATAASATVTTPATFESLGSGNYKITVPADSGDPDPASSVTYVRPDSTYLFQLTQGLGENDSRPVVVVQNGAAHLRELVTNEGCAKCHGDYPAAGFGHYAVGGSECQICHSQATRDTTLISKDATGAFVSSAPVLGTNITEYIHGIHNSKNMPAGTYYRTTEPDATADAEDRYSIGFPSAMNNCSVCHTTPAQLTTVAAAPVSYYLCMGCHQTWDGFVRHDGTAVFATDPLNHKAKTSTSNCMGCHAGDPDKDEAGDFHTFFEVDLAKPDAHYNQLYRGEDISFANPTNVDIQVTEVAKVGTDVTFKWTATKGGVAVNPCNTDLAAGPLFTYPSSSGVANGGGLGAYLAYAKGDDWVNEGVGTSPGQPASAKNLFSSLATTCDANVATTTGLTISPNAPAATEKALLAIGGKPMDTFVDGATSEAFFVRVPSPTYAFSMTDGAPATARRDIIDSTKCTGCHVGTLYQHGGDRVDNVQLCVICHNPASSDKKNRVDFQILNPDGTVDTDSTYDGKTAESFDMRTLIHSIHSVGNEINQAPIVIYRSRGIYSFVNDETAKPTGWPEDGMTIYGSDTAKTIAHNWTVVHYPKAVNECEACHNPGTYEVADQTKAVALTVDAGTDWADQSDDIVIGPNVAACISCHNSGIPRSHAESFGYKAKVTKDAMLELSK